ncbi:hypothetical protein LTR36_001728 [Oleoguttula mirabilis]|uniref:AAA+ ATPase domain-containing protein n=1 Tax=Oleoguttula mirabilis TaxID=1507867 RepID=A0AAV9JPM5_9PEZI|nr:hypothetical protein LTR36_001728 [Oleoguttula mirabilis]
MCEPLRWNFRNGPISRMLATVSCCKSRCCTGQLWARTRKNSSVTFTVVRTIVRRERGRYGDDDDVDTIDISCLSLFSGPRILKRFLEHVQTSAVAASRNKTTIYRPERRGWMWNYGVTRPSRNLNAVTLDSGVKEQLVKDIEAYLNPKTRKYYSNRGIPWRRGFLFYGPPGTGKTSFTTALAGHFKLDVFMLSLSSSALNDQKLESLFESLPTKCMVTLEDIDSAGIRREDMNGEKAPKKKTKSSNENGQMVEEEQGLTLSGLLNVLDGIHSVEGRIIIITTNNPDSLDEALVRRGRIDQRILFAYATREVSAEIFRHVFCKSDDELLEGEVSRDHDGIAELARQFAANFPADKLTPAEVQGFLLDERASPEKAVEKIAEHAEGLLKNKARGVNVASFKGAAGAKKEAYAESTSSRSTLLRRLW